MNNQINVLQLDNYLQLVGQEKKLSVLKQAEIKVQQKEIYFYFLNYTYLEQAKKLLNELRTIINQFGLSDYALHIEQNVPKEKNSTEVILMDKPKEEIKKKINKKKEENSVRLDETNLNINLI